MATKTRLAIFDIDGTIFRSSLIIESFNALVRAGVFPYAASERVERTFIEWLNRKGHYNDYLMTLVREYYVQLKGKRINAVEPIIERVIKWQKDRVYRYTRDLVAQLRRRGFFLIAVSNSQSAMAYRFAQTQGFNASIGRVLEERAGRYTGRILVEGKPYPTFAWLNKVALVRSFCRTHDIIPDFRRSIAVGDSEADIDMLSLVGHPIAFNPSHDLAVTAQRRKWPIVVERKDVMFSILKAKLIAGAERQRVRIRR